MRKYVWIPLLLIITFEVLCRSLPKNPSNERSLRFILFDYLENKQENPALLLGSSVFANYIHEVFPSITNLSFDGANAYTGLEIIYREKQVPKVLFIEMGLNSLYQSHGLHKDLIKSYEQKYWTLLRRKLLHSSRKENNLHLLSRTWIRNMSGKKEKRGYEKVYPQRYEKMLSRYILRQKQRYKTKYYESQRFKGLLQKQKKLIDHFIKNGTQVFLVRSPEAKEFSDIRKKEYAIEEKVFSRQQYQWIHFTPSHERYPTTDGIHLTRNASIQVIHKLLSHLKPTNRS